MRFSLLILCFLVFGHTNAQNSTSILHPIVQKAKETSLYSANVNWEVVNSNFVELTRGENTVAGLKDGLQYLINSLEDKHASIRLISDYSIIAGYKGSDQGGNI